MSKFYGTLQGCRGAATRCGTDNSGIRAAVQSWDGSCITELNYVDNNLVLSIGTANDSRSHWGNSKYYGSLKQFNELMDVINDVGIEESIKLLKKVRGK